MEPSHVFTWRRGIASVELFGGGAYLVEREWIVRCSQRFTRRARVRYGRRIWKEEKARGGGVAYVSAAVGGEDAWFQVQVRHKKMTFGVRVHTC